MTSVFNIARMAPQKRMALLVAFVLTWETLALDDALALASACSYLLAPDEAIRAEVFRVDALTGTGSTVHTTMSDCSPPFRAVSSHVVYRHTTCASRRNDGTYEGLARLTASGEHLETRLKETRSELKESRAENRTLQAELLTLARAETKNARGTK